MPKFFIIIDKGYRGNFFRETQIRGSVRDMRRLKKYDAKYLNKNLIEIKLKTLEMIQYRIIIKRRASKLCGGGVKGKRDHLYRMFFA